jgi:hypothetical protein
MKGIVLKYRINNHVLLFKTINLEPIPVSVGWLQDRSLIANDNQWADPVQSVAVVVHIPAVELLLEEHNMDEIVRIQ